MKLKQKLAVDYLRLKLKVISIVSKKKAAEKAFELFRTPQRRTTKEFSQIFKEAETLRFKLEGTVVQGYRWNKGGVKKVLIVHGFESSIINFEQYVRPLINKGYEVLAFDAPAHGHSGGKMITAPLFAKMITDIYQKYGPVQSFIAHSFGGLVLSIALEEIQSVDNVKIVFIAPLTELKTAIDQFFQFLKLNERVRKEFDELIVFTGGQPVEWYSTHRAIKNIQAKILWIQDQEDEQTPIRDAIEVKKENLPNVQFIITKGLGHRKIYRDQKIMQQIVDFL